MPSHPFGYPEELRAEAVRLCRDEGLSATKVAAGLGVSRPTVQDWIRAAETKTVSAGAVFVDGLSGQLAPGDHPNERSLELTHLQALFQLKIAPRLLALARPCPGETQVDGGTL